MKKRIRSLSAEELSESLQKLGLPKYRTKQIEEWLWKNPVKSFEEMTNLSKELRTQLEGEFDLTFSETTLTQVSEDGTIKLGIQLFDNRIVEGVLIPSDDRMTACVSSQVGCSLSCAFCATGFLKRERNLDASEIVDQLRSLQDHSISHYGKPLSNIVFMGMGEPLLNYDQVIRSIQIVTSPDGLGMSPKRITISTSGISRGIIRLAEENKKFNLALSLHAANDEKRDQIMDVNKSNPIQSVMESLKYFYKKTGNKITFEYILFKDFNDSAQDAKQLTELCKQVPAFVNIIEYNPVEGTHFQKPDPYQFKKFIDILETNGVTVKVRRSRGKDIDAACGQLANKITNAD